MRDAKTEPCSYCGRLFTFEELEQNSGWCGCEPGQTMRDTSKRVLVTDADLSEMRSWIEDTFLDGDDWLEFTDDEYGVEEANALILRGVERNYVGGVREFVANLHAHPIGGES